MADAHYIGFSKEDRDLLIRLDVKVDNLGQEVKEMRDETKTQVSDHETRIRAVERNQWIGFGALGIGQFLLSYFHPFA